MPVVAAAPAPMPHVVPPAPLKLDWSVDLTQIETDRAKLQSAQAAAAAVVEAPRTPRVRPQLPPLSHEPLVQVETARRENAQMSQA
jgi:ribonuclease E